MNNHIRRRMFLKELIATNCNETLLKFFFKKKSTLQKLLRTSLPTLQIPAACFDSR